ncbi:hypothetical protein DICVIV_02390 [Dictyocaulus viviparus]|uniref:Uncharacterized protein n=1 Tax=Dictyocaulus viviparus TaxID=29172 RepID=A0A0D8Y9Y3_DICVI|nr:hypothetical protein DICVIV_02390 [Dictyocaulus viviparus]
MITHSTTGKNKFIVFARLLIIRGGSFIVSVLMLGVEHHFTEYAKNIEILLPIVHAMLCALIVFHSFGWITSCSKRKSWKDTPMKRASSGKRASVEVHLLILTVDMKTESDCQIALRKANLGNPKRKIKNCPKSSRVKTTDRTRTGTAISMLGTIALPRAPKGNHDEELDEMEKILEEESRIIRN